jgi:hypothetical protein
LKSAESQVFFWKRRKIFQIPFDWEMINKRAAGVAGGLGITRGCFQLRESADVGSRCFFVDFSGTKLILKSRGKEKMRYENSLYDRYCRSSAGGGMVVGTEQHHSKL